MHPHLGRRPPGRAAAPVRGPAAGAFADRRAAGRGRRRRHGVLGLRRPAPLQGRAQRRGRPSARGAELRADPLRRDAARRVGHRRPRPRHGPQRRVRVAELPVVARRASPASATSSACPIPSSRSPSCAPPTTGTSTNGRARYPGRIIPCQVPWLLDPDVAAAEVRANAARGFRAVTFPELPERLGLPSLHTGYWDPLLAACEETGTVVCLHVGSSSTAPTTSSDAPADTIGVLFFGWAMFAAVDWLYSRIPVRFPGLRICLSEGGIGWVAGLLDRLDHVRALPAHVRHLGRHRPHPGRGAAAQLLVLRHRGPLGARAAPPHRRRPHLPRVRLPAPGRHLARHPGDPARAARRRSRRRRPQAHVGERVAPVRLPRAGRRCRRIPMPTDRPARRPPIHDRGGAAHPLPGGVRLQRRRPRERPGRRRRRRVLGHRVRVLRPDDAGPRVQARLRPAARGSASSRSRRR